MGNALKKGSLEMLVLALLEDRPRHGYELGKLIEQRSERALRYHVASLYPTLYGLERRGLVQGAWGVAKNGRKRRCYRLTRAGRRVLAEHRSRWRAFSDAIERIVKVRYA
ncbi:MAG TPA: PadR family transcriptional regulator [Candidatus Acidoferrales bacterium]|nr:PadR family transcriptional regulator [Candidatus Acidoferrales bacterium]